MPGPQPADAGEGGRHAAVYDTLGRTQYVNSPHGAVYLYQYRVSPPTFSVGAGSRQKSTTQDGLGRAIKEEMLAGAMVVSIRGTEYGLCACSPMGKLKRVSEPYAPGAEIDVEDRAGDRDEDVYRAGRLPRAEAGVWVGGCILA